MLEVGAFFLRTETELVLKSRRVVHGKLLADGFNFRFPCLREAVEHLVAQPNFTASQPEHAKPTFNPIETKS
jgi:hypothetical protein